MALLSSILLMHVQALARAYQVSLSHDAAWVQVADFVLPPGFNAATTTILLGIPPDYPLRPVGVLPYGAFVERGLRYCGGYHPNIVESRGPGWGTWSWLCLYRIVWDPQRDDLVRCLELVRTVLSAPSAWRHG